MTDWLGKLRGTEEQRTAVTSDSSVSRGEENRRLYSSGSVWWTQRWHCSRAQQVSRPLLLSVLPFFFFCLYLVLMLLPFPHLLPPHPKVPVTSASSPSPSPSSPFPLLLHYSPFSAFSFASFAFLLKAMCRGEASCQLFLLEVRVFLPCS